MPAMKKWQIGDKVKFLNEKGGGMIVAIKNHAEVIVQMPDGIEIPYLASELIPDNKTIVINTSSINKENENVNNKVIYLAIESNTTDPSKASEYYLYLFNLSDYQCYYTCSAAKNDHFQILSHGKIQAFEKYRIKTLSHLFIKEIDLLQIQIIFFQEQLFYNQTPVFQNIRINEKTFHHSLFISHPEFERPVHIILLKENFSDTNLQSSSSKSIKIHLSDDDLKKIYDLKEKIHYVSKPHTKIKKHEDTLTLDLHIEELIEDPAKYTAHQKLQIQMQYFERELHNAIAAHVKKIIIIHGVGNGRLKEEVRAYLKTIDEVKSIEDAPYKTHGFGATIAYIK